MSSIAVYYNSFTYRELEEEKSGCENKLNGLQLLLISAALSLAAYLQQKAGDIGIGFNEPIALCRDGRCRGDINKDLAGNACIETIDKQSKRRRDCDLMECISLRKRKKGRVKRERRKRGEGLTTMHNSP